MLCLQAQMGDDDLHDADEGELEQLPTPQELSADLHAIEEAVAAIDEVMLTSSVCAGTDGRRRSA